MKEYAMSLFLIYVNLFKVFKASLFMGIMGNEIKFHNERFNEYLINLQNIYKKES